MRVTVLGSGTSHGVPMIGCHCPVCTSDNPRNKRLRASILLHYAGRNVLVDTTFELRLQALAAGLERIDAVLLTHQHADHVYGFDDLRRFCALQKACIPCYGNRATIERMDRVFDYVLHSAEKNFFDIPVVSFTTVDGPFELFGQTVTPIQLVHGRWPCFGYRIGDFAYCTDVHEISESSMRLLEGLDVLILGALRHRPHVTHFTVAEALAVVERVRPRRTWFTHIAHDLEHEATNAMLPAGVELAWDGLVIDLDRPAA